MMRRSPFRLLCPALLLALFLAGAAGAAPLPPGVEAVTSVEGIDEYRLSNGLRVLLFPDPSKETITVNITYLVGSRHESYGETGMAHLLEHLMFKGSTSHPHVPDELTSHGCRPNGTTWFDRTNYFETMNATDENLEWALDLEADRMVNSFIAKKDLESEFSVVRNEFERGENNPREVLEERVFETAYLWHNYGNPTIGCRADIENVPIERLQAFYRTYYQPDNAILVVAGEIDPAKTIDLVAQKFGSIPRPSREISKIWTVEPPQDGERIVTLKRVGDIQALSAAYHVPSASHEDFAAVQVLSFVLGDTPSGRLYKALVEPKLATSVGSTQYEVHDPGLLIANAELRKDDSFEAARAAFIQVLDDAGTHPITEEELGRAKDKLAKDWDMMLRNTQWAALQLSEWAGAGDWRLMFLHRDRVRAVTAEAVQQAAARYLRPTNRTLGLYTPVDAAERVQVPDSPDVQKLLADYKGGQGLAQGEDFDASPDNIESRVVRATLPNGLKLVLLPKKTRGASVNLSLSLHFGTETSLKGKREIGELTGEMLLRGTAKRSRQQISDDLDRLKARLWVGAGAAGASGSAEVSRENLPDLLRLLAEILREPSFPADEFELLKQETLAGIEENRREPGSMVWNAWDRQMSDWPADDVRYTPTPDEEIASVQAATREQLLAFHADFYGASAGELAVVGDFDPAATRDLLQDLLGGWSAKQPYKMLVSRYKPRAAADIALEAPDKENANFRGGMMLDMTDDHEDFAAMSLGTFMTGGGFLNSRIATRLRQKDGVSYGCGAMFWASKYSNRATWSGFAIYAPQNVDKVLNGFREEVARVLKDGFTKDEVEQAKSGWLQQRQVSRGSDAELVGRLQSREFEGRTMAWDKSLEAKVAQLTPDEILAAMRRHLDLSKMTLVRAGDFARGKTSDKAEGGAR